jgi:heme/copper-type cytochrome/quinol oxidase subunit 2
MNRRLGWVGLTLAVTLSLLGAFSPSVTAQQPIEVALTMEREQLVPTELRVKAGTPFVLVLTNKDDITHELDIPKLRIEKKVRAGQTLKFQLPALKPGTYELADDDSTPELHGVMIAE